MNRKITDFFRVKEDDSVYQSHEVSPYCHNGHDINGGDSEHDIDSEAADEREFSEQSNESDSDDASNEIQFVSKSCHNGHDDEGSEASDEREFSEQSDESNSDDDDQFVSKNCKLEDDVESGYAGTKICNKEDTLHSQRLDQKLQIVVHGLENGTRARKLQTNGKETTLSMIKKYLKMFILRKSTSVLILKDKRTGSALNLGLPTGTLDKNVDQCIFKRNLKYNTEQLIRAFKVELYNDEWPLKSFRVKFDIDKKSKGPYVCKMSKVIDLIDVPFLIGETLYEALCRDGRFDVKDSNGQLNICKCELEDVGSAVRVPLDNDASEYGGKTFELYFSKKLNAHTVHEFKTIIENDFNLKVEKEGLSKKEKKRIGKVKKFVKDGYDKFALNRNFELSCSHLRKLLQLCESTGAIVLQLYSGEKMFIGTCFRVGHKYVMTNYHVYKIIEDKKDQGMLKSVYIDFSYKGNNEISACSSTDYKIITYSVELDYAIIEVKKPKHRELPISVTSCFTIPCLVKSPEQGMFLTFSGHPNGSRETMTNLFCPLKSLESLDERVVMGLSKNEHEALIDPKRQFYDVSTFFYGSSGSPGVLLQDGFLLVLHCGQYPLNDGLGGAIEQGVLMAAIVADVKSRHVDLVEDIFDLPKDMEVDSED